MIVALILAEGQFEDKRVWTGGHEQIKIMLLQILRVYRQPLNINGDADYADAGCVQIATLTFSKAS